ncbi:hypothetical protein [Pendulispora albinea]|uniref:Uncharacterized protein n=1 Tax=Pendulispora albinea TaxID=2741071 RepID=A0ABZ2LZI0_9BACT
MPRRASQKAVQISMWMPLAYLERADVTATRLSRPGFVVTRTDIFRMALARGLDAAEAESDGGRDGDELERCDPVEQGPDAELD